MPIKKMASLFKVFEILLTLHEITQIELPTNR